MKKKILVISLILEFFMFSLQSVQASHLMPVSFSSQIEDSVSCTQVQGFSAEHQVKEYQTAARFRTRKAGRGRALKYRQKS